MQRATTTAITKYETHSHAHSLTNKKANVDLHNCLAWNELRDWKFCFTIKDAKLFYLNDHIQFIKDIIRHWRSSPYKIPPDLLHFVPYRYTYDFNLENFVLNLHVNEYNLIERPNDPESNGLLIV